VCDRTHIAQCSRGNAGGRAAQSRGNLHWQSRETCIIESNDAAAAPASGTPFLFTSPTPLPTGHRYSASSRARLQDASVCVGRNAADPDPTIRCIRAKLRIIFTSRPRVSIMPAIMRLHTTRCRGRRVNRLWRSCR